MKRYIYIVILLFVTYLVPSQNKNIEITYERKSDNSITFYYSKNLPGSYSVKLEFTRLENSYSKTTHYKVIKYKSGNLLTIKPANKDKGISFSYKFSYLIGDPNPKVNASIEYSLPFIKNKEINILEASNLGETYFGNRKPIDWKSFIVYSNTSDTICSMRKGKVVNIINDYVNNPSQEKVFTSKRNKITIEHDDGTYAIYTGFDKQQIFIKLGQVIYPQTRLGKLEKFNKNMYRLDFSIFHYFKNALENNKKETLTDRKYNVKYLDPKFITNLGVVQIESGKDYKTTFETSILLQELTRKEKKKLKKNPKFYH
ncbi:hypothetical protein [Winogradskyella sp. PE311]|uniref:hypothetical protein n=1 Tax=Winogradskyella sp. PE311 TaxID=3366943 RepID=UPI003981865A